MTESSPGRTIGHLPVLGSVAHAIAGATGVWIRDLPITPEKILKALKEMK